MRKQITWQLDIFTPKIASRWNLFLQILDLCGRRHNHDSMPYSNLLYRFTFVQT